MRSPISLLIIVLAALAGLAQAQDIADIYSNLESCDVTVSGDVADSTLNLQLSFEGKVIQTRSIALDGPGTWVATWSKFEAQEGSYQVCAALARDGEQVAQSCYAFSYGGRVPVRFDVRDFQADSRGIHMTIAARDPTIVDMDYMLISGNKVLYLGREEAYAITGGSYSPVLMIWEWKQLLDNGRRYAGRVKITELSHGQTRAFMTDFVAKDDARITETYEDEMGASATVLGSSRVPFEGKLRFVLFHNGTELDSIEKKTPVLLVDDDETVEISWNETLDPGIYRLQVLLMGNNDDLLDMRETVIEAEEMARPAPAAEPEEESPMPVGAAALALLVLALARGRRRSQA
ncbi:MAG: hypothetical protein GKC10_02480 [Methanosarcinales archaeon]|nr:hypothetical protein [Methanosarcinales archaeon]